MRTLSFNRSVIILGLSGLIMLTLFFVPSSLPSDIVKQMKPAPSRKNIRLIDPLFHSTNLRGGGAADVSIFLQKPKHPHYDVIIDVGVYDGKDYTIPGYKLGYTVFAFELDPKNRNMALHNFALNGFKEGVDYTLIDVEPGKAPVFDSSKRPHIYFVKAGASNSNSGVNINGNDVWSQVKYESATGQKFSSAVVRIDDVVKAHERVYLFKTDTQGHEYGVFDGARKLLSSPFVKLLQLEMWPEGMIQNGFSAEATLNLLYDNNFKCYDVGFHGYNVQTRPSEIHEYVKYLLNIPRSQDIIGGWDDMFCTKIE